jgi:hypothetical protein
MVDGRGRSVADAVSAGQSGKQCRRAFDGVRKANKKTAMRRLRPRDVGGEAGVSK